MKVLGIVAAILMASCCVSARLCKPGGPIRQPHPDCCGKFVVCQGGDIETVMNCPAGLHWCERLDRCEWPYCAGCDPKTPLDKCPGEGEEGKHDSGCDCGECKPTTICACGTTTTKCTCAPPTTTKCACPTTTKCTCPPPTTTTTTPTTTTTTPTTTTTTTTTTTPPPTTKCTCPTTKPPCECTTTSPPCECTTKACKCTTCKPCGKPLCPPGKYGNQPHPCDCTKFVVCMGGGIQTVMDCPAGLHWSVEKGRCEWPFCAGCDPSIPKQECPVEETPRPIVDPPCP